MGKGYTSEPLSFNRRMVRASASVTSDKNAIHSFTEVDVTERQPGFLTSSSKRSGAVN